MPQDFNFEVIQPYSELPDAFRKSSGRYEADIDRNGNLALANRSMILRIDLDGQNPTTSISGDLFNESTSGPDSRKHWLSFRATSLVYQQLAEGEGILRCPLKLHLPNENTGSPPSSGIGRLDLVKSGNAFKAVFTRYFLVGPPDAESPRNSAVPEEYPLEKRDDLFRHATVNVFSAKSVMATQPPKRPPLFNADGVGDELSVEEAFQSAGIRLTGETDNELIDDTGHESGGGDDEFDQTWTDEELHAVLVGGNGAETRVDWMVNLLFAGRYQSDRPNVTGIMFDPGTDDSFSRQGAAVFCDTIRGLDLDASEMRREFLFTTVHELGHTFNLLHSFQKDLAVDSSELPRPAAISWMNYPRLFPYGHAYPTLDSGKSWDGRAAFWTEVERVRKNGHPCLFDLDEIIHMRHGDRPDVVMGGRWAVNGPEEAEMVDAAAVPGDVNVSLVLPEKIEPLEQLVGYVRLINESDRTVDVPANIYAGGGAVDILVKKPNERHARHYHPIALMCGGGATERLDPNDKRSVAVSLSYGHRWWYVDDVPGMYQFQVLCRMPDGRTLRSEIKTVDVPEIPEKGPELKRSDLYDYFQRDTGMFIALNGSRSESLSGARARVLDLGDKLGTKANRIFGAFADQTEMREAWLQSRAFKGSANGPNPDDRRKGAALIEKLLKRSGWLDETTPKHSVPTRVHAAAAAVHAYRNLGESKTARDLTARLVGLLDQRGAPKPVKSQLRL